MDAIWPKFKASSTWNCWKVIYIKKNKQQCRQLQIPLVVLGLIHVFVSSECSEYSVCVEVLRPSQPNRVMSSAISLLNHTFTGQAGSSKRLTSIVHILSPETDNCPSWISGRERMTVENISWSISTKECCRPRRGWTRVLLVSIRMAHPTERPRPAQNTVTFEPAHDKTNKLACAPSEDLNQPGRPPSLTRVFAACSMGCYGLKLSSCGQRRFWSDLEDGRANLSLCWASLHAILLVLSCAGSF